MDVTEIFPFWSWPAFQVGFWLVVFFYMVGLFTGWAFDLVRKS